MYFAVVAPNNCITCKSDYALPQSCKAYSGHIMTKDIALRRLFLWILTNFLLTQHWDFFLTLLVIKFYCKCNLITESGLEMYKVRLLHTASMKYVNSDWMES